MVSSSACRLIPSRFHLHDLGIAALINLDFCCALCSPTATLRLNTRKSTSVAFCHGSRRPFLAVGQFVRVRDTPVIPNKLPLRMPVRVSGAVWKNHSRRNNNFSPTTDIFIHAELKVDFPVFRHVFSVPSAHRRNNHVEKASTVGTEADRLTCNDQLGNVHCA
jgi:hypothetical protein